MNRGSIFMPTLSSDVTEVIKRGNGESHVDSVCGHVMRVAESAVVLLFSWADFLFQGQEILDCLWPVHLCIRALWRYKICQDVKQNQVLEAEVTKAGCCLLDRVLYRRGAVRRERLSRPGSADTGPVSLSAGVVFVQPSELASVLLHRLPQRSLLKFSGNCVFYVSMHHNKASLFSHCLSSNYFTDSIM